MLNDNIWGRVRIATRGECAFLCFFNPVAPLVWDQRVEGSNPFAPTIGYLKAAKDQHLAAFFVVYAVISWQLYLTGDFVLVVVDATYS